MIYLTCVSSDLDACDNPEWIGDGYCDDENNNAECNWDGGDCCGDNVFTDYCTICGCFGKYKKYKG